MKILQVNKFNYLRGGAEKYFLDLCGMLEKEGHEVARFSMAHPKNFSDKHEGHFVSNVDFNEFKFGDIFSARGGSAFGGKIIARVLWSREAARKFEKLILDFQPDIVHLHNIYHQISPSIISVAKKHNLPIAMHLHDYKLICPNYKLFTKGKPCYKCQGGKYYNCALNRCLKNSFWKSLLATVEMYLHHKILKIYDKVDLFIAPSQFMKDICISFGVPAEKVRVVYNFVGTTRELSSQEGSLAPLNKENYILYFGRLSEEKGIGVLIDAIKKVNGNMKLKIVGEGPEFQNFKFKILNLKLNERIEMLGVKYGEELQNLIAGARAIIIPSVWPENMPLSLLEAMAAGKIVIASRIGGMPEIVEDGKNGFLFEAGSAEDLAGKINKLNKLGEEDVHKISEMAMLAVKNFNPQKHIEEIMKIYEEYVA